jgi:hypothetical protein
MFAERMRKRVVLKGKKGESANASTNQGLDAVYGGCAVACIGWAHFEALSDSLLVRIMKKDDLPHIGMPSVPRLESNACP